MRVNEKNYIRELEKGNEKALNYIIDKYLPLVKGISTKILAPLGDNGLIEECINDIFISVWNNKSKFKGDEGDFRNWICKIGKFKAIDYYRSKIKKCEIATETIYAGEKNYVEDEIVQAENRSELINIINTMGDLDKKIFIMKFFLDMNSEDIGKRLDISRAAVDNRIYRGKKKIKEKVVNTGLEVVI